MERTEQDNIQIQNLFTGIYGELRYKIPVNTDINRLTLSWFRNLRLVFRFTGSYIRCFVAPEERYCYNGRFILDSITHHDREGICYIKLKSLDCPEVWCCATLTGYDSNNPLPFLYASWSDNVPEKETEKEASAQIEGEEIEQKDWE